MTTRTSPEIASSLRIGDCTINYHDQGKGEPILLIHGSGPGVTAWANWRGVIPELSARARVIAPDMLGFGYTQCPAGRRLDPDAWVNQLTGLLDALDIATVSVVGNSFGGAIALALAQRHPQRVKRLVLMGSAGLSFPITEGLEKVWGYQPSLQAMGELMGVFAYDHSLINDDLVRMRYEASIRDDVQSRFAQLFPAPRQQGVEMLAVPEAALRELPQQTLLIHGRDDRVIPLEVSERLLRLIPHAQLHVFGECGHWVQIERARDFTRLLIDFLTNPAE
ncbi:2-hydroxymuconate-semialdehyde hydrolase [Pseudomonas citronellolis]|uniref:alpha/beta fold hydrolase n=1 Tax=Pseudomonas citronellolis TaxID=53408 RepID=UPI0020A1F287|nr:alpha/beta fold hydrolase [Pseudomonas citronellolis]MCP1645233.1 2-hydroxymuconate-semialdehyde hydrolase [Pseudomonas citronellolis]MCP1668128.1 2-hydroxymuconate-semialdehyde hydrolase [Pseudomonas citronellolis]MCP1699398.1 2-hydroxymuconate-semialdehyde hydrolase [Pseudomonas citronellolis]MCP1705929.1 2-hydroxymuconate-semialdehyde hydrolase [Pseudomonas citronellolis]MCP1800018.1 2-hydroxymuconate-semialdehyde hydrolase [Pseudomonas citronellolis]